MSENRLQNLIKTIDENRCFFGLYFLTVLFFFLKNLSVGWDPPEYLGFGKYLFSLGEVGYSSWYRPLVWPLILGFFWWLNFPMPFTMQLLGVLIYMTIPIMTYFHFKDGRKFIGLLIISQPMFFKYSHLALSHLPATLFLLLAYMSSGVRSGVFAVLSGFSRFSFFLAGPLVLISKDWKQKFMGMAAILIPYFLICLIYFGNPLFQFISAQKFVASEGALWFWEGGFLFYLGILLKYSPLLLLPLFFNKKPSTLVFLMAFAYFTWAPHNLDRFLIDIAVFGIIALCERFERLPLLLVIWHMIFLPLPAFGIDSYLPGFLFWGVNDDTSLFGMEPGVNAFKDVRFYPWFSEFTEMKWDVDYCLFSEPVVPCREDDEYCIYRKEEFRTECKSWIPILNYDDNYILARNPE